MLNVVGLFQIGGLVDLVVDLVQLGLAERIRIKSMLEGIGLMAQLHKLVYTKLSHRFILYAPFE